MGGPVIVMEHAAEVIHADRLKLLESFSASVANYVDILYQEHMSRRRRRRSVQLRIVAWNGV